MFSAFLRNAALSLGVFVCVMFHLLFFPIAKKTLWVHKCMKKTTLIKFRIYCIMLMCNIRETKTNYIKI